jgi:hypothetical protein
MWRTVMVGDQPIRQQLNAGEQLLWSGRPRRGIRAAGSSRAGRLIRWITPFVYWLFVMAIFIWINLRDVEGQVNSGAIVIGVGGLMVGWAMMVFALGYEAVDREHTFYGLTDQRIIRITGILHPSVWSCPLQLLQRIHVRMREDGSGTIAFADVACTYKGSSVVPTFEKIDNVQSVYHLIHQAKEQAQGANS